MDFLYLGDKIIDFEARIVEGDKTLLLGDLDIVPKKTHLFTVPMHRKHYSKDENIIGL